MRQQISIEALAQAITPTKVFISYSQGSKEHNKLVLDFSNTLCADGIDVELDQYHQDQHLPKGGLSGANNSSDQMCPNSY